VLAICGVESLLFLEHFVFDLVLDVFKFGHLIDLNFFLLLFLFEIPHAQRKEGSKPVLNSIG